jgi:hypothetical protein
MALQFREVVLTEIWVYSMGAPIYRLGAHIYTFVYTASPIDQTNEITSHRGLFGFRCEVSCYNQLDV